MNKIILVLLNFYLNHNLLASEAAKKPPMPHDVQAIPYSRDSVLLKWNITEKAEKISSSFKIEYGFYERIKVKKIATNEDVRSFIVGNLRFHTIYRMRVALEQGGMTSRYSQWLIVRLDVETFVVQVQLPSETRTPFQKALYEVLPLSYLSSKELNATNIDLDTSLMEAFYEIYFPIGVNFTAENLYRMFARNHARAHTSYVRNVNVSDINFCKRGLHECSRYAKCIEAPGSYSCECFESFYDYGIGSHLFNGRNCTTNSEKPKNLALQIVNYTSVRLGFQAPKSSLGPVSYYEAEYSAMSGDDNEVRKIIIEKIGLRMRHEVSNLAPNGLYRFRARAVTIVTAGRWSGWTQIRLISSLFKLIFQLKPKEEIKNFQATQKATNRFTRNQVKKALRGSTTVSMVDFIIARSDLHGNGNIRFIGHLYVTHQRKLDVERLQKATRAKLKSKFRSKIGVLREKSVKVQDFDECGTEYEDCSGNKCVNKVGYFVCQCPVGVVDISNDLNLLPGRKCIVFDAPLSFSVSLLNPEIGLLNWKIPPQLRKPQLKFWFVVQYKLKNSKPVRKEKVELKDENFSSETYVVSTTIRNLKMNTVYSFRVAVANKNSDGHFTAWKNLETSNLIFTLKLNLTLLVYSRSLRNRNHDLTVEAADNVRTLLDRLLVKTPQYMATGKVNFKPGIQDRTFAVVHIFFNSKSNVNAKHIQDMFKHNSFNDEVLGLDFDAVSVKDFNECKSKWDDCARNATCVNETPGFKCVCHDNHVDLSETIHQPPGRSCLHKDLHTTPEPTTVPTTPEVTTPQPTTAPMPFPKVRIAGSAIGPNKIKIRWFRTDSLGSSNNQLNYDIQYRIKGTIDWAKTTVGAFTRSLNIGDLRQGLVYEVRIAERWKDKPNPHTLYSFPREIRTEPRAYRIYLHLPDIPPVATVLSALENPDKERLINLVSNYINTVFSHPDVANAYSRFLFGSTGDVSFVRHPDRGVMVSAILYLKKSSSATETSVKFAYKVGAKRVPKQWQMKFMTATDLDECSSPKFHDCSTSASCQNSPGSFTCQCFDGFADSSKPYFLLPGRYCVLLDAPLSPATFSKTRSSNSSLMFPVKSNKNLLDTISNNQITTRSPNNNKESTETTAIRNTTPASPPTPNKARPTETYFVEPVNMIGLSSGDCPKGQRKVQSLCQDVLIFAGSINVLKQSGNNLTASNLLGNGRRHLTKATEEALNTAFNDMPETADFLESRVQKLTVKDDRIHALFVIILSSFGEERFRRQISFVSIAVDSNSIKKGLQKYLFEKFPEGKVVPAAGAAITFNVKGIKISNINECTWRLGARTSSRRLHNCDLNGAECRDTTGSFMCECKAGTEDRSPKIAEYPGRVCEDQCNPSPCLNGAACSPSKHVGSPSCECTKGLSGDLCADLDDAEGNNLTLVALAAVAGVVFLFISCFAVTFYIHRRNKRKGKLQKTVLGENQGDCRSSESGFSSDEFSNCSESEAEDRQNRVPVPLPRGSASHSPRPINQAINDVIPPPAPARTSSIAFGSVHENHDLHTEPKKLEVAALDRPPIPSRDPISSAAPPPIPRTNPSTTSVPSKYSNRNLPAQANISSVNKLVSNRNGSGLPKSKDVTKIQSNDRNKPLPFTISSTSKHSSTQKTKKQYKAKKAIRGRIRKHSDEYDNEW